MAQAKKLKGAVGVSESGALDSKHFIGRVVSYRLPDEPISAAKLVREWKAAGLDPDWLPEMRAPVHVFQSACASVKRKRGTNGNGTRTEINADEVELTPTVCSYQITVKVWDKASRVIEHEKAMRVQFERATSEITVAELDHYDKRMEALERDIREHYDANGATVPGQKLRNAIKATLERLGAQNMKGKTGGVYFVPMKWWSRLPNGNKGEQSETKDVLDGLSSTLDAMYGGERADFWQIPLVNDEGQRTMVRKHFKINAAEKSRELCEKALGRVKQGKGRGVRADLLANLHNERRAIAAAVRQFEELVGLEKQEMADNISDLDRALAKLQDLADSPD